MSLPPVAANQTLTAEEIKYRAESIIEDLKQYADRAEADRRLCRESVELIRNTGATVIACRPGGPGESALVDEKTG